MKTPKYITTEMGADGKERFYYRRPGQLKIRIRGVPWTPSFMAEYEAAKTGTVYTNPVSEIKTGTFNWLCDQYYDSGEFRDLDETLTKPARKRLLTRISKLPVKTGSSILFGDVPLSKWNRKAVRAIRDRNADVPGTANDMIGAVRVIFNYAIEAEVAGVDTNPADRVKDLQPKNIGGFHTWTMDEVEQYEAKHPTGTQERLAMDLLLYSSQRLSDVIAFGEKHIKLRDGVDADGNPIKRKWIVFTQHKNRRRKPVHLEIPLRPELEASIAATPIGTETFLTQKRGKKHTRVSFGKVFAAACIAAKVPGRSHGLRKASAVRMAEEGSTDKEIMSITGHTTLQQVTLYTKAANQKKLASAATDKMKPRTAKVG